VDGVTGDEGTGDGGAERSANLSGECVESEICPERAGWCEVATNGVDTAASSVSPMPKIT
jgi:hypothetical protein